MNVAPNEPRPTFEYYSGKSSSHVEDHHQQEHIGSDHKEEFAINSELIEMAEIQDSLKLGETTAEEIEQRNEASFLNWDCFKSNVLAHVLIWCNLAMFSVFLIVTPYSMKLWHPLIFAFVRCCIIVLSLFPMMLLVDRHYTFTSEKYIVKRARRFRIKHTNIYASRYLGWIYSVFYDEKSLFMSYIIRRIPDAKKAKQLAFCGTLVVLNQVLFVAGLYLTNSTITGVIQPVVPVIVCSLSMMMGKETKSFLKFIGVLIAVGGAMSMLLVSALSKSASPTQQLEPDTNSNSSPLERLPYYYILLHDATKGINFSFLLGLLCLLGNTFSYAIYLIFQRSLLIAGTPPTTVTFWSFFFGLVTSFLCASYAFPSFSLRKVDTMSILGVLYAAIPYGSLQFVITSYASKLTAPTIVSIYSTVSPLVATTVGVFYFKEIPSPLVLVGAAFILVGVFVVIGARYRETKLERAKLASIHTAEESVQDDNDGTLPFHLLEQKQSTTSLSSTTKISEEINCSPSTLSESVDCESSSETSLEGKV
ncbi:hypothetical protein C9374_007133 [Naegleria lovaniensis]|uniref:EamA domain-containing protein n=1 Tax=Naegleria lovaniensis TaxID=51637 RepID=A0AA88H6T2_NAELO|nr:uncharacterized protein C9374_007133 [Naegleria lovaniensis]KAG2393602.1 hypothetical protein C9374_007133 [Naegleria lovaniensis]